MKEGIKEMRNDEEGQKIGVPWNLYCEGCINEALKRHCLGCINGNSFEQSI